MKTNSSTIKATLVVAMMMVGALSATAYHLQDGELSWNASDGEPATIGQTNQDHLFVRNYADDGPAWDNILSFESGKTQLMWLWLDDDQIYQTDWVQALTPDLVTEDGDLYNEITYYSFQFLLYVPQSLKLVKVENEEGDMMGYEPGPRMPIEGINLTWGRRPYTRVIDGVVYNVYSIVHFNSNAYCVHFSSRNPNLYMKNGALRKDDGALVGFYIENTHQDLAEGRLGDIIIANMEFGIRETRDLDTNHQRFFYGKGGNEQTQRYLYYTRVATFGSKGYTGTDKLLGDANNDGEVSINDVSCIIDLLMAGQLENFNAVNADMNDDDEITINDVAMLVDLLLLE